MTHGSQRPDRSTWAAGGGAILGFGVGLFFLQHSALAFLGSLLGGLELGLIITALISARLRPAPADPMTNGAAPSAPPTDDARGPGAAARDPM